MASIPEGNQMKVICNEKLPSPLEFSYCRALKFGSMVAALGESKAVRRKSKGKLNGKNRVGESRFLIC